MTQMTSKANGVNVYSALQSPSHSHTDGGAAAERQPVTTRTNEGISG